MPYNNVLAIVKTKQERLFLDEISELRDKFQGNSVLTYGSSWTAEVREPDRKRRLHKQLKLAQKLRLSMESAADKAEKSCNVDERFNILMHHASDLNSLVSLTTAVNEGSISEDYNEYTLSQQNFEIEGKNHIIKSYNSIVHHLALMTDERDGISHSPTEPERHRSNISYAQSVDEEKSEFPTPSMKTTTYNPKKQRFSREKGNSSSVNSSDDEYEPESNSPSVQQNKNIRRSRREQLEPRATARPSRRRNVSTRRCHDCKSSTTYFRRCHYWFLTGTKCGKVFCSKCLKYKYGEDEPDWDNIKNDNDWHCPSCLGKCLCADCVRDRKRAMKKDMSTYQTRRSFSAAAPLMETSL